MVFDASFSEISCLCYRNCSYNYSRLFVSKIAVTVIILTLTQAKACTSTRRAHCPRHSPKRTRLCTPVGGKGSICFLFLGGLFHMAAANKHPCLRIKRLLIARRPQQAE